MDNQSQLQREFDETRQRLEALRDQIRVKLHLASLDAKDVFRDLEGQLKQVGRVASHAGKTAMSELAQKLEQLSQKLDGTDRKRHTPKASG